MQTVMVNVKRMFGKDMYYPVGSVARNFSQFTSRKTLSVKDISLIIRLGHDVQIWGTVDGEYGFIQEIKGERNV